MSKLIWSIWLLLLSVLSSFALSGGTAGIPVRLVHCAHSVRALSFDHPGQNQAHIDYDGSSKGIFGYDGATVRSAHECVGQSANTRPAFAPFAEFLAAESGIEAASEDVVSLYHQGNLPNGVSATRSLSTSPVSLNNWLERGLARELNDMHYSSGILRREIQRQEQVDTNWDCSTRET
jgi:hypothetical protein